MRESINLFIKTASVLIAITSFSFSHGAKVDSVKIWSTKMEKYVPVVTITPSVSKKEKDKLFPIIILLHGFSDNQSTWIKKVPELKEFADKYKFIVVCPDANYGGWYIDSYLNNKDYYYESFITTDLINYTTEKLPSIKDKTGRFITGLSMGGFGALYIAIKYPHLFHSAASLSGALDLTLRTEDSMEYLEGYILGDKESNLNRYENNSIANMTDSLKASEMEIYLSCGVSDFVLRDNRNVHKVLQEKKIPHVYVERKGGHTWDYWRDNIEDVFIYFTTKLK